MPDSNHELLSTHPLGEHRRGVSKEYAIHLCPSSSVTVRGKNSLCLRWPRPHHSYSYSFGSVSVSLEEGSVVGVDVEGDDSLASPALLGKEAKVVVEYVDVSSTSSSPASFGFAEASDLVALSSKNCSTSARGSRPLKWIPGSVTLDMGPLTQQPLPFQPDETHIVFSG